VISTEVLAIIMWVVIAAWLATAVIRAVEFHMRRRQEARSASLFDQLTTTSALLAAESLPEVSPTEFQELVLAGLPEGAQVALAQELRTQGGDETLLALVSGQKRGSIDERIEALQILVSGRHPDMYRVLADALRSPQPELANIALRLLRALNDQQSANMLVEALQAGTGSGSRIAAALNRMTTPYGAFLGPLLLDENPSVRFWGLLLVGRTGASQWIASVRRLTTDREPTVRRAAVEALGRIGSSDDKSYVIARLLDPVPMVRVHGARAAVPFADAAVASAVARLLGDREWIVRAAARDALRDMRGVATPAVIRVLWQGDPFAANNAAEILFLTGEALTLVRGVLDSPTDTLQVRLVERLVAAAGPQILRAISEQLDPVQQSALQLFLEVSESKSMVFARKR
jgi:HEAT repeat protein